MIVWSNVETSCPMCGHRMRVRAIGGGFAVGQDSDLLVRMQGRHVIQAEIHTCPDCHYSGYASDFIDRKVSDPMVERYFREFAEELEPDPSRSDADAETPMPHLQYYWSALLAPLLGLSARETGLRMLRAYWCLRLPPSSHLPERELQPLRKLYLRQAIAFLRKAVRREREDVLLYLVGELCRRNSSWIRAENYFDRFLNRAGSRPAEHQYLRLAAAKLLEAVHAEDSSGKTMEEILYPQSDAPRRRDRRVDGAS